CSLSSSGRVSSCRGGPSDSFRRLGQTSGLWSLGRLAESGTTASTAEAEEDADGDDDGSADEQAPHVGRRLRVWFLNEDDDRSDYEYGTVIEVHDAEGSDEEVTVEWDAEGQERLRLAELPRFEWLGDDLAADLSANLKEFREEAIGGAEEAGAEMVAMPVEHLKKELESLGWMRRELAVRAADTEALRRENEELKAQREDFRERFGEEAFRRFSEEEEPSASGSPT
ncbi:unnamed protein product, partial [Polarella glacialis]